MTMGMKRNWKSHGYSGGAARDFSDLFYNEGVVIERLIDRLCRMRYHLGGVKSWITKQK